MSGLNLYYPQCTTFSPLKSVKPILFIRPLVCHLMSPNSNSKSPSKNSPRPACYDSPLTTVSAQSCLRTESKYMAGTINGWDQLHKRPLGLLSHQYKELLYQLSVMIRNDQIHTLFSTTNGYQICLAQSET